MKNHEIWRKCESCGETRDIRKKEKCNCIINKTQKKMDVTVRITRKRDNIKVTILYIIVKDFKAAYEKCDEFLTVLRPSNKDDIEITLTRNRK